MNKITEKFYKCDGCGVVNASVRLIGPEGEEPVIALCDKCAPKETEELECEK